MKETPTARKLISLICGKLHVKRDFIKPETTFESINVFGLRKKELLEHISERFLIRTGNDVEVNLHDGKGKYIKDTWPNTIEKINTVWNVLQFVESNDDFTGKPAAQNIN